MSPHNVYNCSRNGQMGDFVVLFFITNYGKCIFFFYLNQAASGQYPCMLLRTREKKELLVDGWFLEGSREQYAGGLGLKLDDVMD